MNKTLTMTYRNNDLLVLKGIAVALMTEGFSVSSIVIADNEWMDGVPYFHTNAKGNDILSARRAVR